LIVATDPLMRVMTIATILSVSATVVTTITVVTPKYIYGYNNLPSHSYCGLVLPSRVYWRVACE
jgi:hypothetical protein